MIESHPGVCGYCVSILVMMEKGLTVDEIIFCLMLYVTHFYLQKLRIQATPKIR
jgi:hypothetical protein